MRQPSRARAHLGHAPSAAPGPSFGLLGPVTVHGADGIERVLRAAKARVLLAALLMDANRPVSRQRLTGALWGQEPPATSAASLKNLVVQLRRFLDTVESSGGQRLQTAASGYLLKVEDGELDTEAFSAALAAARTARAVRDWPAVSCCTRAAAALWRGEPLADLADTPGDLHARAQYLAEARLQALEWQTDADLELGRHGEVVAELRERTDQYPLHEAFHAQLVLALYRAGRQADALEALDSVRTRLREQLGVDPGPGLRSLHRRVLNADPRLHLRSALPSTTSRSADEYPRATGSTARTPRQLPAATSVFTGRAREVARLLALGERAARNNAPGTVTVAALDGMGGIGKSALAVYVAHRISGRFPDGQLFIDLHGHTPGKDPLSTGEALDALLRGLGVPAKAIPQDLDERSVYYRDQLAGTKTLILLDNAAGSAQVRPLIPAAGCLVLVTSRRRLTGLDEAHNVSLDVLGREEAASLLRQVAGPGRIAPEDRDVEELVALCGYLPLAIRITAARLRHRGVLSPADLVTQLRDSRRRLERLQDDGRSTTGV